MPSKDKEARLDQKGYLEIRLNRRLADLAEKGFEPSRISKDSTVRKLRAEIRKTNARLKVIKGKQEKLDEMVKAKVQKAAEPKKEKGKKQKTSEEEPGMSKRQQKKREKKGKKDGEKGGEA